MKTICFKELLVVCCSIVFSAGAAHAQTIWHVDDDALPGGDGTSWDEPLTHLQDALAMAMPGDDILVATGVYMPDQDTIGNTSGNRNATFQMISGVRIFGGYAGLANPLDRGERDIGLYPTVLSGDLEGNDSSNPIVFANYDDNSYNVVTGDGADATAVLEGFTITGGNANGTGAAKTRLGAGMHITGGSPTIRNCVFYRNTASISASNEGSGGALYTSDCTSVILDCVFRENRAADGGAVNNASNGNPEFINCLFVSNAATAGSNIAVGGAIATSGINHSQFLVNCTFFDNRADSLGGAVYFINGVMTMDNCIVWANSSGGEFDETAQLYAKSSGLIAPRHSCIESCGSNYCADSTDYNIGDNPQFVETNGVFDLRLQASSPCIDSGENSTVWVPTDLDGNSRIADGDADGLATVDMGAYEFQLFGVTYDGDTLLSTEGNATADALLIATIRDMDANMLDFDDVEISFHLTAEGVQDFVVIAITLDGVAELVEPLEPAIYTVTVTVVGTDISDSGILVVYNPEGGSATGGGWIEPVDDGANTHPLARANFGFNARYKKGDPTGHLQFRYSDGYLDLKSGSVEHLVITGGRIVQFKGWAEVNGEIGHWFFAKAIDNGEPGTGVDVFDLKIWGPDDDLDGDPAERAGGVLQGGNIVIHNR